MLLQKYCLELLLGASITACIVYAFCYLKFKKKKHLNSEMLYKICRGKKTDSNRHHWYPFLLDTSGLSGPVHTGDAETEFLLGLHPEAFKIC